MLTELLPTRLGLDVRNWIPKPEENSKQTRQRIIRDFTYALTEQEEAPPEERNNPGEFLIDREQKLLLDPDTGIPIIKLLRWQTESDFLENECFSKTQEWATQTTDRTQHQLWISPPSKKYGYTEARFVVYRLSSEDNQEILCFDAGCGTQGKDECLKIANSLLSLLPESNQVQDDDELRTNLIPFSPPTGMHWADYLAGFITPHARWEIIKREEHRQKKRERKLIAEQIVANHYDQIRNLSRHSSYEHLVVGAQMEEEARRRYGITFQAYGSHGSSNTEALNKFQNGTFNSIYSQATSRTDSEKTSLCKKCHKEPAAENGVCSKCK